MHTKHALRTRATAALGTLGALSGLAVAAFLIWDLTYGPLTGTWTNGQSTETYRAALLIALTGWSASWCYFLSKKPADK